MGLIASGELAMLAALVQCQYQRLQRKGTHLRHRYTIFLHPLNPYDLLKSLAYQSRIQDPEFSEGWLEWVLGSASCSEAHSISRGTCRCGPIQAHPSGSHILKGKMSTNFDFSWLFCVPSFP